MLIKAQLRETRWVRTESKIIQKSVGIVGAKRLMFSHQRKQWGICQRWQDGFYSDHSNRETIPLGKVSSTPLKQKAGCFVNAGCAKEKALKEVVKGSWSM